MERSFWGGSINLFQPSPNIPSNTLANLTHFLLLIAAAD
jgi:hypothetical protein